ncbi:MAG TPA: AI-2E family transporter [Solirubrobacteraceae bacterium]|nr:AI-2E family transporter [Solirubrobacteraceae bacterium]
MRRWARLRTADPKPPEGEPDPEAVEAGGPVDEEGEEPGSSRSADADDSAPPQPAPPTVAPVVVPRWIQLVVLPLALLGLWALARAAGSILLVVIVAALAALILAPTVRLLERWLPRGLAILIVYLGGFAVLAGIGVLLASPVTTQITHFENNVPSIVRHANHQLDNFQTFLTRHGINVHIKQQGSSALDTLQKDVLKRSGDIVSFSRDLLSQIVTVGFDLVLILVLSIYLLIYGNQIGDLARRIMPPGDGTPEDDYPLLVQHAVSGYVRGQLLFSLVMGGSAAICLEILGLIGVFPAGRDYGVFFGAFYGLMEFIPYIGPIVGPIPAILVALFNNPISAVWLIILFVALQQLEGHVVAPQVFRISLRINPIIIILALLIGFKLYGVVGALVALPVIAVIRQTVVYLQRHLVLEPWGTRGVGLAVLSGAEPDRCPDCGAPATGGDAYCRACGASLEPRVTAPR